MGVVEQSYETVESYLSTLDESYESFAINQTTVAVSTSRYGREREHAVAGTVDLYTKVRNDNREVLHVREGDELVLPSTKTATRAFEHAASAVVEEQTGVKCQVADVEQATILGICDSDNEYDPVYRLVVVFEATRQSGSPGDDAVWRTSDRESALAFS